MVFWVRLKSEAVDLLSERPELVIILGAVIRVETGFSNCLAVAAAQWKNLDFLLHTR